MLLNGDAAFANLAQHTFLLSSDLVRLLPRDSYVRHVYDRSQRYVVSDAISACIGS